MGFPASPTNVTSSTGDLTFASDSDASGAGDIILSTKTVERLRISSPATNVAMLSSADPTGVHGPINLSAHRSATFAGTVDPVMYLGYNAGLNGQPQMVGEPVAKLVIEGDYNVTGEQQAEPVVLFGCDVLAEWAHDFPEKLAAAEVGTL